MFYSKKLLKKIFYEKKNYVLANGLSIKSNYMISTSFYFEGNDVLYDHRFSGIFRNGKGGLLA